MKETRKQLNKLIRDFYDESEAMQIARDIEEADRLLTACDAPRPRTEVIEQIKQRMIRRSAATHRKIILLRSMFTAAAACLIIGTGVLWMMGIHPSPAPPGNTAGFAVQNEVLQDFFSDDTSARIATDVDEISDALYTVDTSIWDSPWEEELNTVEEIEEMDLLTNNDFWKG